MPFPFRQSVVVLAVAAALIAGCGRAPGIAEVAAEPDAQAGSTESFDALDVDANRRLSRSEAGMPGFAFDACDRDGDGGLTFFEWNMLRNDGDTAFRTQQSLETVRETANSLRNGTAIRPVH